MCGWAEVPVKAIWIDNGMVMEERYCRMVAGSIGMEPGKHVDFGVKLNGLLLPPAEADTKDEDNPNKSQHRKPETTNHLRKQLVQRPTAIELGAPPVSARLDAVKPRNGWWIFEESRQEPA